MAYDPTNNPYIPGDPASYDLKWIIDQLIGTVDANEAAARAQASADAALASAEKASFAADSIKNTFVTPEMFGAKGDGISNDTSAFNQAINQSLPIILSSKAIYSLDEITIPENSIIIGNGATLKRISGNAALIAIPHDNVSIKDIIIDGNMEADSLSFSGIKITGNNCYLTHIIVKECRNEEDNAGIYILGSNNTIISNIVAYNNDKSAIYLSDSINCIIEKILAYNNAGSGITSARTSSTIYRDIVCHDNGYSNLSVNGSNCIVINAELYNSALSGLNIGHNTASGNADNSIVYNVKTYNNTIDGITIQNSKDVKIYNSISEKNTGNNSRLWYDSKVYFENCIFANCTAGAGIVVTSGKIEAVKCRFEYNAVGVSITNSQSGIADNCEFIDNSTYHGVFDHAINSGIKNSIISNILNPLTNAVIVATCTNIALINNTINGVTNEALFTGTNSGLIRYNDQLLSETVKKQAFNLIAGNDVTIDRQVNFRIGRMIFGSVTLTPTSPIAGGSPFISIPLANMGISINASYMTSLFGRFNNTAAGFANYLSVNASGEFTQNLGSMTSTSSFMYMMILAD